MFFIYSQLRDAGVRDIVVIDAEDTDVIDLAAHATHQINGLLGIKRRGSIYDCQKLCWPEVANVFVPFHIYTGADSFRVL